MNLFYTWLKKGVYLIVIVLVSQSVNAQSFLGLKDIISGSYNVPGHSPEMGVRPINLTSNAKGGELIATIKFKVSGNQFCTGQYRFTWTFSKPVDRINQGETINVSYTSEEIGNNCRSASAKMIVTNHNGASPEFKSTGITRVGGLSTKNTKWLTASSPGTSNTTQVVVINTSSEHATIKLNFESTGLIGSERLHYEVVYLLERGYEKSVGCDEDLVCHNLYSVGVLVGFAEYGASKNDNPNFLADQLDGAIIHAEASKCVPTDGLIKMSRRLRNAGSSLRLHPEISALRVQIARYVEQNCNCCR